VVVPIGPRCQESFINDTLDSIEHFCPDRSIILVDDSGTGMGHRVAAGREARVLSVSKMGLGGGLYGSLSAGFRAALDEPFDILLRIDTDGLVASGSFLEQCSEFFKEHPRVGALGSYRRGFLGTKRDISQPRKQLLWEMSGGALKSPRLALHLARLVFRAVPNGYRLGESVMGGVTVYSREAVEVLARGGALEDLTVVRSRLQEDHLFALWLHALRMGLADFGSAEDNLPFAAKHRGLPAHPNSLLAQGKSLVHSTKYFGDLSEAEIRKVFSDDRSSGRVA
jgi:hypothetical protein